MQRSSCYPCFIALQKKKKVKFPWSGGVLTSQGALKSVLPSASPFLVKESGASQSLKVEWCFYKINLFFVGPSSCRCVPDVITVHNADSHAVVLPNASLSSLWIFFCWSEYSHFSMPYHPYQYPKIFEMYTPCGHEWNRSSSYKRGKSKDQCTASGLRRTQGWFIWLTVSNSITVFPTDLKLSNQMPNSK